MLPRFYGMEAFYFCQKVKPPEWRCLLSVVLRIMRILSVCNTPFFAVLYSHSAALPIVSRAVSPVLFFCRCHSEKRLKISGVKKQKLAAGGRERRTARGAESAEIGRDGQAARTQKKAGHEDQPHRKPKRGSPPARHARQRAPLFLLKNDLTKKKPVCYYVITTKTK